MAAGWQIGAQCLPSAQLAASQACSMAFGVTSSGLLSCSSATVLGDVATLIMSDGQTADVTLLPCDRMTYADTWGPLFLTIVLGTITIWGVRLLIDMFKTGDQHV